MVRSILNEYEKPLTRPPDLISSDKSIFNMMYIKMIIPTDLRIIDILFFFRVSNFRLEFIITKEPYTSAVISRYQLNGIFLTALLRTSNKRHRTSLPIPCNPKGMKGFDTFLIFTCLNPILLSIF